MKLGSPNDAEFELVSVDPVDAPDGGDGSNWYRYRIAQGCNKIVGYRRGSKRSVRKHVREIISGLNERRIPNRKGRVHLSRLSNKNKRAAN